MIGAGGCVVCAMQLSRNSKTTREGLFASTEMIELSQCRQREDRHADQKCEHFDPGMFANDGHEHGRSTAVKKTTPGRLGFGWEAPRSAES